MEVVIRAIFHGYTVGTTRHPGKAGLRLRDPATLVLFTFRHISAIPPEAEVEATDPDLR
jgi:hypothetical protein